MKLKILQAGYKIRSSFFVLHPIEDLYFDYFEGTVYSNHTWTLHSRRDVQLHGSRFTRLQFYKSVLCYLFFLSGSLLIIRFSSRRQFFSLSASPTGFTVSDPV